MSEILTNQLNLDLRNQDRKVLYTCIYPLCPEECTKVNMFKKLVIFMYIYILILTQLILRKHCCTSKISLINQSFTVLQDFNSMCFRPISILSLNTVIPRHQVKL